MPYKGYFYVGGGQEVSQSHPSFSDWSSNAEVGPFSGVCQEVVKIANGLWLWGLLYVVWEMTVKIVRS